MTSAVGAPASPLILVRQLVEASQIDTVYRDLYVRRARAALATALSAAEYGRLKEVQPQIQRALQQTRLAVVKADWQRVREFAGAMSGLKRRLDAKREEFAVGCEVYEPEQVPLDPFSPGFAGFVGGMAKVTGALERLGRILGYLERLDPDARDQYGARRLYFQKLTLALGELTPDIKTIDPETAELEALRALDLGEVDRLCGLAETMLSTSCRREATMERAHDAHGFTRVLAEPLPIGVVARARELGLAYVELGAVPEVAEYLHRNAWHPTFPDSEQTENGVTRVQTATDPEMQRLPEGIRQLIALFALHPYVNSGGARYLPRLRAQPVLVEDFPEDAEPPVSSLLIALGLGRRRALSRLEIEAALLERGCDVVTEHLGLDAWRFRLVCVPFDVYARVGPDRGWGRHPQWTHFDGYQLMRNGQLRALVGGDARYGGVYDLVSIGRDDQREGVSTRFAVVRRERLLSCAQ